MADYKSNYTGEEIDGGIAKANTALQENDNVSKLTNDAGYLVSDDISGKQDTLVSGTNIKTINNNSILGEGNLEISGGGGSSRANYEFEALSFDMANNQMILSDEDLTYIKDNYPATLTMNIPESTMKMNFVLTMPTGSGQDDFTYAMTIPMGSAALFSVGFSIEPRTTEDDPIPFTVAQIGNN